jgi:hypothetical protein
MNSIAYKIEAEPWRGLLTPQAGRELTLSVAFCVLLDFRIRVALGENKMVSQGDPFRTGPLRTGFFGVVDVFNLPTGLLTVQNVFDDLHLSPFTEVAFKAPGIPLFRHYSGPSFGPFEHHFDDLLQTLVTLQAEYEKCKPSAPMPPK